MSNQIFTNTNCLTEEQIIKYNSGELSGEELRSVEEHIIDCPLCSDALEGAEKLSAETMKKDFAYLKNEVQINSLVKRKKIIMYSAVAALLIIAGAALLNITKFAGPANKSLFNQYFEVYPDVTFHKRGNENQNDLAEAMNYYNQGNFQDASEALNKIILSDENETAIFYKAVSLTALGKTNEALKFFSRINNNPDNKFYEEANWYAALCLIDRGKTEEAKKLLHRVSGSVDYGKKANKILEELHDK